MHDIDYIRENSEEFDEQLARRGIEKYSEKILELDRTVRESKTRLQILQQKKNQVAKEIGFLKSQGKDAVEVLRNAEKIKIEIKELEENSEVEKELHDVLSSLPNILSKEVIKGNDENDNQEIKKWGEINTPSFKTLNHYDLGEKLGLMDFNLGAKISGSRFVVLKGELARLERVLANFMLDLLIKKFDFEEVAPPFLVNSKTLYGSGQLPKFSEDCFVTTDNKWLIPTAEVPLVNLVQGDLLREKELPLRFCAYTPCFRSEAGAAGKDTRGMIRLHQFSKVEMVAITHPDKSEEEHEQMLGIAEEILQQLKIPYRVVLLCSGDTGFSSRKTYDLEVWLPGQEAYREISSCSNCGDFQARRMKTRFKNDAGKINFVHSLNGSSLAVGRTLVAILENYQNEDGSITIPEVLVPYFGKSSI